MSKRKEYAVTLIFAGYIIQNLHYGPYCHNWWLSRQTDKTDNIILFYPIRLNMKTLITLHNFDFIIEIVESVSEYGPAPGYLCRCKDIQSEIFLSPTNAISSVYQKIMKTATKFSVWILGVGKSSKSEWNYAGAGYKAAFIYMYQKQRCIFFEEFDDDNCKLTIYNKQMEVSKIFINIDPDLLWKQVNCLQQYNGKKLFGLEEPYTQNLIQSIKIPTCSLDKWKNNQIMECVYNYHLKRRLSTYVNWLEWFNQWQEETSTIIELQTTEKQQALDTFLMDKAHVVMSSYKTDTATNELVHYLKHTKKALWEKFHEQYPDGIKRASFFKKLEGNKYTYREDLEGLCHTCQQYGYEIFSDLA
ncbi:22526_t:CDS:2, partial [Gigaspora rosea]